MPSPRRRNLTAFRNDKMGNLIYPCARNNNVIRIGTSMLKTILAALLVCSVCLPTPTMAAEPVSLEDYFKSPTLAGPILSRSGKFLAATAPSKGRMNLLVIELATRKGTILTSFEDFDVRNVRWIGDERLVFSLGQANSPTGPGQFDGGGLFVIDRDGSKSKRLAPTVREAKAKNQLYRGLDFEATIPGSADEIIVSGNQTSADSVDLYRLNLNTGRTVLLTNGRPVDLTVDWVLDSKQVPRVVTARVKDELTQVVYYRKGEGSPWNEIARFARNKGDVLVPLAFESDDQTLQVATNKGRDTMAVFRYDPNSKTLGEVIASHPRYDMGADSEGQSVSGVLFDRETNKILGYRVDADKPETVWVDESRAKTQKNIDATLPGMINTFRRTPDGKKLLITSYSDTSANRWYLLDEEKNTLEEIGAARPWMDGKLVDQRSFLYKTRDGLEIPGYLFLPKDYKAGTKLPTIVHIHGGPAARADSFAGGFGVQEGQLFASRGYAVVVPNFRITPGMGNAIFSKGFGTIGRQMSEDHEDALKWAIDQGYTDPKRACISGASYGGYAALQAMVKTPDLFKCAVAGLAVTDLTYQLTSTETDFVSSKAALDFWRAIIGTDDFRSPLTKDMSPINHAAKIKGAVFMYAGRDDVRVPIDQMYRMDKALKAAGNPPKAFVIKEKEGHGFGKTENNIDLYRQVLAFLKEQIGDK
jgi:dipeptidyl aminopeptidase/acylaminoacyl peptidase